LKLALSRGETLQRGGDGIESALEAIQALEKWLWIKLALGFELADATAGTPPSDAEAYRTDPESLSRHQQRAEEKARRIHSVSPWLDVWRPNAPRVSCAARAGGRRRMTYGA